MIINPQESEELMLEDYRLELENRIKNLLWTISGDYSLDMKVDLPLFRRSKAIALYDGVKQGALARYFDQNQLALYLIKKIYMGADQTPLTAVASLCIEEAIYKKLIEERPGIANLQYQCCRDILEQEYEELPQGRDLFGQLRLWVLRDHQDHTEHPVTERIDSFRQQLYKARDFKDTGELITLIDHLYNSLIDPSFEKIHGDLHKVLSVTLQELQDFNWEDELDSDMYEEALEKLTEQMSQKITQLENAQVTEEMEKKHRKKKSVTVLSPESLEKSYSYVELNYGRSYLSPLEQNKKNHQYCRDIHADCSLYYTEGILKNPVRHNYQYEYAKRLKNKNVWTYHEKHRVIKRNIALLTEQLNKALVFRSEVYDILSDYGKIRPERLWRIGRCRQSQVFTRTIKGDASEFVVDILIDASGSQMSRQGDVACQAYIISEALLAVNIPTRVQSFCTFWDYTILHRFRDYNDPRSKNEEIFNYITSSNNRDGLAIRAIGGDLMLREEERKILIVLSDGRPYDAIINRPNARNPIPYEGREAVNDTAKAIRSLRGFGVNVLGVFAGEDKDLGTEKKIFGKDFAYIRDIGSFSHIVGRYLIKQLENDD